MCTYRAPAPRTCGDVDAGVLLPPGTVGTGEWRVLLSDRLRAVWYRKRLRRGVRTFRMAALGGVLGRNAPRLRGGRRTCCVVLLLTFVAGGGLIESRGLDEGFRKGSPGRFVRPSRTKLIPFPSVREARPALPHTEIFYGGIFYILHLQAGGRMATRPSRSGLSTISCNFDTPGLGGSEPSQAQLEAQRRVHPYGAHNTCIYAPPTPFSR